MKLTHVEIDGRDFILSGERDLVHVMSQIEAAAASPPAFVDLSDGDDLVSVLIHSTSRVVVSVETDQRSSADYEPLSYPNNDWDW
ncbi:hypothetical protein [Microbacterium hydrocarbonoxydans]|uniref:hypothetical protein n=1 Tax=Microbacterium hydrocarbonoxydans TaxID=273678 RepID=UPI0020416BD7|nr:hypothetical protein [Microbacterium hydrocarbonoxydans]MCM3780418.1 hypothetical protein [Microbacterium hydrocarbonoxydans]